MALSARGGHQQQQQQQHGGGRGGKPLYVLDGKVYNYKKVRRKSFLGLLPPLLPSSAPLLMLLVSVVPGYRALVRLHDVEAPSNHS